MLNGLLSVNYEKEVKGKEIPIIIFIMLILYTMKSIF